MKQLRLLQSHYTIIPSSNPSPTINFLSNTLFKICPLQQCVKKSRSSGTTAYSRYYSTIKSTAAGHTGLGGGGGVKETSQSLAWKRRQEKDPYVKQARLDGSPSRAIYKLQQIDLMATKQLNQKIAKNAKKNSSGSTTNNNRQYQSRKRKNGNCDVRQGGMFTPGTTVVDLGVRICICYLYSISSTFPCVYICHDITSFRSS